MEIKTLKHFFYLFFFLVGHDQEDIGGAIMSYDAVRVEEEIFISNGKHPFSGAHFPWAMLIECRAQFITDNMEP